MIGVLIGTGRLRTAEVYQGLASCSKTGPDQRCEVAQTVAVAVRDCLGAAVRIPWTRSAFVVIWLKAASQQRLARHPRPPQRTRLVPEFFSGACETVPGAKCGATRVEFPPGGCDGRGSSVSSV